jgi:hypothetical protein
MAILQLHVEFIISSSGSDDIEMAEVLQPAAARAMIQAVVEKAAGMLGESQTLWKSWLDWEMGLLEKSQGYEKFGTADDRQELIDLINDMFTQRVQVPHLGETSPSPLTTALEDTKSAYSSFCSQYCPNEYEARLVAATQASQSAKEKLGEKRYGQTRLDLEQQLVRTT